MDDKGRCLEQVSLEIQRLTFVEVQKAFLAGEVERGADLLSMWEQYLELSKIEPNSSCGHETLSTTVGLFLKRLSALQNVLNSLPKQQCVNNLQTKLNTLEERISFTKTGVVGGGTFEWVDSILVKCLREGSWLMVDNVNLCSPAVLDRMNGLLEPGGELVLGERGVDRDGQLVTVKPHPDFRLFLVMDPRFGEISRAMRNRGVELYLLNERESPTHELDLRAILSQIGLKHYSQQTALLNIHQEVKNLGIGIDPITTSDMLHSAALTVEQTLRGQPLAKAMRSACYDVYVQSRQLSPDQRDRYSRLLGELFQISDKLLTTPSTALSDNLAEVVTLSTQALQENSAVAQLKQKCALLSNILRLVGKNVNCNFRELLKEDFMENVSILYNKNVTEIVPYVLLTLISSVTENDLRLRRNIIISEIMSCTSIELRNKLLDLEKYLVSTVQEATKSRNLSCLKDLRRNDLCWDLRRVSPWILNSKTYDYENRTIALLYYFTQCLQFDVKLGEMKTNSVKNMSALEFSTAYNKGKVTLESVTDDAVLRLSVFLETLEDQIHQLLESGTTMDEAQCCRLLCSFHWSHRLAQLAQQPLFLSRRRHPEPNEELVSLLRLHVGWVRKWLFPELARLLTPDSTGLVSGKLPPQLLQMCANISLTHPVRSVSKKVRMLRGQPLPWSSKQQVELIEALHRLEAMIDFGCSEQTKESVQEKVEYLLSAEGKHLRRNIVKAFLSVNSGEDLQKATELLNEETSLPVSNLPRSASDDKDKEVAQRRHASSWSWEVPLWPLRGVICLRLMASLRLSTNQELADCVRCWAKELPLVPPSTVASASHTSSLGGETTLTKELSQSVTVTSPRPWLQWASLYEVKDQPDGIEEDDRFPDERKSVNGETYSLASPLLALFSSTLLYPECHLTADMSPTTASLRSLPSHTKLLASLKQTLWTFGPALAAESLNYGKNEEQYVKKCYVDFLKSLESVLKSKLMVKELNPKEKKMYEKLYEIVETKTFIKCPKSKDLSSEVESLFTDLARHMDNIETAFKELHEEQTESIQLRLAGLALIHLGLAQMKLFSHQDPVDPVQKKSLKVQYCQKEREELDCALSVERVQGLLVGNLHFPLADTFSERISFLAAKEDCLKQFVAVRPQPNLYSNLYNEVQQFMAVIVNPGQRVERVASSLSACMIESAVTSDKRIQEALARAQSLQTTLQSSMLTLSNKYETWYPDVVVPILSAITQMSHGLSLMIGAVKKNVVCQNIAAESLLRSVVRFPLPDCSTALDLVDVCTSSQILDLLKTVVSSKLKAGESSTCHIFRLAKCSLEELRNIATVRGQVGEGREWSVVCGILDHLVKAWRQQERERAQKEQEEASYFINKVKKVENLTEEEEDEFQMKKLFPSYREKDFADLEPPSLEQKKVPPTVESESVDPDFKLTLENIIEIHKIHSVIVTKHSKAHWIHPVDPDTPDFTTPFANRLSVFSVLLDSLSAGCDGRLDSEVSPALCLGAQLVQAHGTVDSELRSKKYYDFYHDANVGEVKMCVPVLESLTRRLLELLEEWPDHPTLKQIMLVINRVLDFPSHSPVSRFLVGLELLSTKLKEWEENAHAGVTLGPHSAAVTRLILDWRRLELTQWKGCLESARLRLSESAVSKWWFHLYSLVREETDMDGSQLALALNQFMEESNLAEYQTRLGLLFTFHCHTVNSQQKLQSQVLWNVHQYYSQFSRVVAQRVKELSAPVEKKLRDFVKIARWNDINYWSVKETVDKTHRTLFKYIREYESILKQPAHLAMVKLDSGGKQSSLPLPVNPALYVLPATLSESLPEDVEGEGLLCRERSLFKRARKLCHDTATKCPLPQNITALHQVTEELHEVAEVLNIEDIDRSVSKEKQKSAARSVLHRKRKTVTDLFHTLASLGLSYRAGLVTLGGQEEHFTSLEPLNIEAALAQIDNKNADKELRAAWSLSDLHWLHCVARQAQLKTALVKPHKDLGPPIVDRCKGFTNHLMSICYQQKSSMTESVTSLYVLRCLIQLLTSQQPSRIGLPNFQSDLLLLVEDVVYCLAQFEILMDSCPEAPTISDSEAFHVPAIPGTVEVIVYHGDDNWTAVRSKVTSAVKCCKKIKNLLVGEAKYRQFLTNIQKSNDFAALEDTLPNEDFKVIKEGFAMLSTVRNDVGDIQNVFKMKVDSDKHPVVDSLNYLQQKIEKSLSSFQCYQKKTEELETGNEELQSSESTIEKSVEVLLNKVLFAVQELYKSNAQQESLPEPLDNEKTENDTENGLFEFHLREKIILALQNEIKILMLPEVTKELQNLLMNCRVQDNSNVRVAQRCVPLLQQYSLLAQFLVTQQVSAFRTSAHLCSELLSVFIDLANKGFRVPEELLDEETGEGAENMAGGLGLGEGEGEKDVSDQIESQDQLEDAKKPGEHDQEEDKDCKEEEKGIEMTDDFGGKLQDIEKKEDEEGSGEESGEEEEPDKEMGDTEKGADTLDQQIWGGDSDIEEEEEEDKKEEEGDRGEQMGEKEMGARDENKNPQGEEDDKQGNEEKPDKKKEINELEEPEVDDDQVDPYHGKNAPQPEPEALDLPDDLQLDDGEGRDKDEEGEEEDPFDIDNMKEPKLPEEEEVDVENDVDQKDEEDKEKDAEVDSSDEDDGEEGNADNQVPEEMEVDQPDEKQDQPDTGDDGGAKDENKTGEEAKMEEDKKEEEEEAKPSEDLPSSEAVPSTQQDSGSKDQVRQPENSQESQELKPDDSEAAEGPDQQGVGAASSDQREAQQGSSGESSQAVHAHSRELREEKRQRPGDSEDQRALGDVQQPMKKKLKTINMEKEEQISQNAREEEEGIQEDQTSDMYQHIKEAKQSSFDAQTLDAATEDQVAEQKVPNKEDEQSDELKDDQDMAMEQEEPKLETEKITTISPDKLKEVSDDKKQEGLKQTDADGNRVDTDATMQVEGELVETSTVKRGEESTFHTKMGEDAELLTHQIDVEQERIQLEEQLSTWSQPPADEEAARAWERLSNVTADLSRELSEQLRLVLEPTHASRLKGDFRTGRRINMRKVIPYIASQFRKDKIWLRRTKPAKREYQIVLAVDDSSSMADNHSKELAFESLAVVSKALSLLEAGQLAVLSFGDQPKILHQLGDNFTEHCGARLLQQFSFEQQKTHVGALVNFACGLFSRQPPRRGVTDVAQLLVIVSDGRGVLSDGESVVTQAVRRAKHMGVFMVFVIVDNPQNKDSILDIRLPKFSGGKLLGIVPYMDSFPFPFYLILRDINSLPSVLSDALRQWFELVTSTS